MRYELINWEPGRDTAIAFLSLLLFWPIYHYGTTLRLTDPMTSFFIMVVLGNLIVNTLIPAWCILFIRGESLMALGLTGRKFPLTVLLSVAFAGASFPGLLDAAAEHPEAQLAPQILFNALLLWEPLFVFGWLQLRFARAFGLVPSIPLTAGALALYHVGTFPMEFVLMLVGVGIAYATLFAITRNLFVVWPLTWGVGSAIGTIQGGVYFGWTEVGGQAIVLALQFAILAAFSWRRL